MERDLARRRVSTTPSGPGRVLTSCADTRERSEWQAGEAGEAGRSEECEERERERTCSGWSRRSCSTAHRHSPEQNHSPYEQQEDSCAAAATADDNHDDATRIMMMVLMLLVVVC